MKNLFLITFLCCSIFSFSAIYEWKGQSTDYQESSNWSPERIQKLSSDTLVFATKSTIKNFISETVALVDIQHEITISANQEAEWSFFYGMNIQKNGILTINGENIIRLKLLFTANSLIKGTLIFDGDKDLEHQFLGETTQSIVFDSLSICKIQNLNGHVFGSTGTKNVVLFKNGATYWAKDGANPFGFIAPNSKVIFEKSSIYLHEYNLAPSLGGRNYGKFVMNHNGTIVNNFGHDLMVVIEELSIQKGNLKIETPANEKALNMKVGDLQIAKNASFLYNPSTQSTFELSGNLFPKNCTFGANSILKVSSESLYLQEDLVLTGKLILAGKIQTNSHTIILKNTNPNSFIYQTGFIVGPFVRYVQTSGVYVFPVGNYVSQNVELTLNNLIGVEYITCEFENTSLDLIDETVIGLDNLTAFLSNGYWKIEPNEQPTSGTYQVSLNAQYFSNQIDGKDVRMVKRTDEREAWKHLGIYQSDSYQNQILSINYSDFTSFSHFGIVIGEGVVLPMLLEKFTVKEVHNQLVFDWKMYMEEEGYYTFKGSVDGTYFEKMAEIQATNQGHYLVEKQNTKGYSYFQLYANDKLLKTVFLERDFSLMVYPNPSYQGQKITLFLDEKLNSEVVIVDIFGKEIFRKELINEQEMDLSFLLAGIYVVKVQKQVVKLEVLK